MANFMNNPQELKKRIIEFCNAQVGNDRLYIAFLNTQLGCIIALTDKDTLHLLDFLEGRYIERNIRTVAKKIGATVIHERTKIHDLLEQELQLYFEGKLKKFTIAVALQGTPFQIKVWQQLQNIPYGVTYSYAQLAESLQKPQAYRAVAQANSRNKIAIVIPCHRVINQNGKLAGYSGGIANKQWLLKHESQ